MRLRKPKLKLMLKMHLSAIRMPRLPTQPKVKLKQLKKMKLKLEMKPNEKLKLKLTLKLETNVKRKLTIKQELEADAEAKE